MKTEKILGKKYKFYFTWNLLHWVIYMENVTLLNLIPSTFLFSFFLRYMKSV